MKMKFLLFSKSSFEVEGPISLIESYCFQSDFYANYDLLLLNGERCIEDTNEIGARIRVNSFSECKREINRYQNIPILGMDLDKFLNLDNGKRESHVMDLSQLVKALDDIPGIGFSKATKILHTLKPQIIPMIDSLLQREYCKIKPNWKRGNWTQIFMDYYRNFDAKGTYDNLHRLHESLSFLGLTKVRIFDILWWSFLKADAHSDKIKWTTIRRLT